MPKPSIGRIVLFTLPKDLSVNGGSTFPAIVTAVHGDELVNLRLFLDAAPRGGRLEHVTSVPRAEAPGEPWSWCWPPRAE